MRRHDAIKNAKSPKPLGVFSMCRIVNDLVKRTRLGVWHENANGLQ